MVRSEMAAIDSAELTRRRITAATPKPPASASAVAIWALPRITYDACVRSLIGGCDAQGAPVCAAWDIKVGTHGGYRRPARPKAITASITIARRSCDSRTIGMSAATAPTQKKAAQLCV